MWLCTRAIEEFPGKHLTDVTDAGMQRFLDYRPCPFWQEQAKILKRYREQLIADIASEKVMQLIRYGPQMLRHETPIKATEGWFSNSVKLVKDTDITAERLAKLENALSDPRE